ncbi:MAG: P-loop NTPase [Desulfobacteraceae bacterium]|nr:P-loop NTPase [Desulfobacteraceae bacterium]
MEIPGINPSWTHYYFLLRRRSLLIVSSLLAALSLATLLAFSMKPVYQATASLIIDKERSRSPLTGEELDNESHIGQQLTFKTHFKLIKSRPVMEKVLQQVGTELPPEQPSSAASEFFSALRSNLGSIVSAVFPSFRGHEIPQTDETLLLKKVDALTAKVSIEGIRDTRLLLVRVDDTDPQIARSIADAIAENYILYDSEMRLTGSRKILDWLSKQLYEMNKKVEDAEKAFQAFKAQENLISIEGNQTFNVQKIKEMNGDYVKAKSQRMEVEANIQELKKFISAGTGGGVRTVPTFLNDGVLSGLSSELMNAEVEHQRLAGVFRPKHPEIIKVASKINELKAKISQQLQKTLTNAESTRAVLMARENSLQQAIADIQKDAIDTNRKELQYAVLERDVGTSKELYNTLLAKIKQANITDGIIKSNLRLAEPAALPMHPVKPRKFRYLTLGALFGLTFGIGLAVFLENMDRAIYTKEGVSEALDVPVLSEIPLQESETKSNRSEDGYSIPSVLQIPFASHFAESFRQLATNLRFSELNRTKGVYLVTSGNPRDGKSTLTFNLGLTMARMGMKTLVIDADLRIPSMRKIVGLTERRGLTEILADSFSTKTISGKLGELTIGDIHKLIEMQERTGNLYYQNGINRFSVSFIKGQLVDVDWSNRPAEKKLGAFLIQIGKITEKQLKIALASQQVTMERLGQILLHLGFLRVEELAGPLRLHIQENIDELFRCENAEYYFQENLSVNCPLQDASAAALANAMGRIENDLSRSTPFLLGQIQQCLFKIPEENVWVLTSGRTPPNPPELLASNRMRVLVELLRRQYDMIIIDTPPVGTVNDAAVLASVCDGLILLLKAGSMDVSDLVRIKEKLDAVQAPTVGLVLNMFDMKRDPQYYGRYYYQSYGTYSRSEDKTQQA